MREIRLDIVVACERVECEAPCWVYTLRRYCVFRKLNKLMSIGQIRFLIYYEFRCSYV